MSIRVKSSTNPQVQFEIDIKNLFDDYEDKYGRQLVDLAELKLLLPAYTKAFKNNRRVRGIPLDAVVLETIESNFGEMLQYARAQAALMAGVEEAQKRHLPAVDLFKHQASQLPKARPVRHKARGFG